MYAGNQIRGYGDAKLALGSCDQQVRAAEIPHELEHLERTLKGCEQGLEMLIGRLEGSVMRCEPPSPVDVGQIGPNAATQTPVGTRIRELVNVAALMNHRIQAINARLEV